MSGRQQHYLPQFLQRNFHFRKNGREHYVHVHRKDSSFSPNTSSVGQQRDFYGHPDRSPADAIITSAEDKLGSIVNRLVLDTPPSVSQEELAILLASLSLRTKKMRESLKELGPRIFAAISENANIARLAEESFERQFLNKEELDVLINSELAKLPQQLDRNQQVQLAARLRSQLINGAKAKRDSIIRALTMKCEDLLTQVTGEASAIAERAFLQIFETSSAPDKRTELFKEFEYSVVRAPPDKSFILGDCAVVALQSDGKPKLALVDVDRDLSMREVWLPLSPCLAIVGCRNCHVSRVDVDQVNRASAMLSHEFFISHLGIEAIDSSLIDAINTAEPLLSTQELGLIAGGVGRQGE